MSKRPWIIGAVLGALTSLPVMALLYLAEQWGGFPFIPFDLFDWLARVLPGDVITLAIDAIVRIIATLQLASTSDSAKLIEQLMAIGQMIGIGAVLGVVVAAVRSRFDTNRMAGTVVFLIAAILIYAAVSTIGIQSDPILAFLWLAIVFAAWGNVVGWGLARFAPRPAITTVDLQRASYGRRRALTVLAGGSAALTVTGLGLGRILSAARESSGAAQALQVEAAEDALAAPPAPQAELDNRLQAALGTRPELTDNDDFYRIDINTRPLVIDGATWELEVSGFFDNARNLTLQDLMAYPAVTQPLTMGCISNRVGGDLIGTSNWTGAPLMQVLTDLGIQDDAEALIMEGADGFYETISRADFTDPRALLVYGMNGETLPSEHGYPLRVYIPNRYGMKQPKWVTRIEAKRQPEPGYWVVRGWSQEALPQIVSVIDNVAADAVEDGKVPVGGIAWAGDRGITKVEVQVDGGDWQEARLRTPTLSPLTWVQWRYDWPSTPGNHIFRVRATDGTGTLQTEREQGVRPDGATGYHQVERRV